MPRITKNGNNNSQETTVTTEPIMTTTVEAQVVEVETQPVNTTINEPVTFDLVETTPKPKVTFNELRKIDVSGHTEKKNGLTYLSWAWALDVLLQNDPEANWEFLEPIQCGKGTLMVVCAVTAFGKTITMHLPVMDFKNKAIADPDAMELNKAMMRCLAKAIAAHGIGLYIYAGEDVPAESIEEQGSVIDLIVKRIESIESLTALQEFWKSETELPTMYKSNPVVIAAKDKQKAKLS